MLSKLLKHEFRDTARIIPFFYLIVLILSGLVFSSRQLEISWFRATFSVLLILFGIATVIITFALVVMRFYRNLYSNEGYLMFTLPVKPGLLLASKLITAYIWVIVSYLIAFGSICISLYGLGVSKSDMQEIFAQIREYGLQKVIYAIIPIFLLVTLYLLSQIFFSITFANRPFLHNFGIGGAFLVFIATYAVLEIVQALFTIFVPFSVVVDLVNNVNVTVANKNMFNFIVENVRGSIPTDFVIGLGGYIFVAVMTFVLLFMTIDMMKRKVSIK